MKTIAVLVPVFTIEYSLDVLSGISDYFRDKDVRVLIAQTKIPRINQGAFDYQYSVNLEYLKADEIDAYIVISGLYCSSLSTEELKEMLEPYAGKPVFSVGIDLKLKNSYSILADCKKTYNAVVEHLKKEHGCKKIGFFSANSTNSWEALQRYDAFTSALDSNHLSFYPDLVLDGNFTDFAAYEQIKMHFKKREDVNFDAIICANDMMASGCIRGLREIGITVPDDVKVVGFDDSIIASTTVPKLSTISQDTYSQGFEVAELAYRFLNGEKIERRVYNPLVPKFRQSCGCIHYNNADLIYRNIDGDNCSDFNNRISGDSHFLSEMNERNTIISLLDTVKGSNTLKQLYYNLRYITEQCDMTGLAVHFFDDVQFIDNADEFVLPGEMEMHMLVDLDSNVDLFKPNVRFNPHEKVFSARMLEKTHGIFMISPIYTGESNYGYVLSRVNGNKFADYNVYMKILITAIAQVYEYTSKIQETNKLEIEKSDLTRQSRTDELTSILNRRGFIEKGQATLDVLQETDRAGLIFFADMDNLKRINDTYGHQMGDKAIKLQAKALKSVFRSTDVVGRLSGDEFGIVAVGMKLIYLDNIRLKIDMMNEKISRENNLPFTLSISVGAVDLQKSSSLKKLLSEADKLLYEEKRKKHAALS